VCWYHCCEHCTLYLLQRLQCTAPAILSCLLLYSSWASLMHSLAMCAIVSSLVLYILQVASPSCLSILTLIALFVEPDAVLSWGILQFPSLNFQLSTTTSSLCLLFGWCVVGTVREVVFQSICRYLVSSFHLLITSFFAVTVTDSSSLVSMYWLRLWPSICVVPCVFTVC